ncbi:efflux RND transporter permease subunit [Gaoshiqia sediminis]|uniref:Efflux RND transporter permease subunit n=1 Tax=Gaoshiqia sediminis TaxID=2986998 RepID=A0AA41YCR1_9BACT|nr:efflux RND transporter permease subunit [Gaoshiqia sediminis]MCW0484178.1 efflux RND transporter permease subunit [Gaoshiqia sediminis]
MKFIIDRKTLISMLFIGLTLLGYVSYKQLGVELLPNAELPFLYVQASSTREADPAYLENQVVIPLEGAIGTLEGIESLESNINSRMGTIVVYYQKDVDFNFAYLKLQEKINEMQSSLPEGIRVSVNRVDLARMNNQFMELQARGSGGVDRVRNLVDEEIAPKLENIDGIAGVNVYGGQEKSIEIILDEGACEAYNITPGSIRSLLSQNAQSRSYVGNLKEKDKLYFVHVTAEYDRVSDVENLVVANGPILLKDVAQVRFGVKEETSYSRVNGLDAVTIQLINDSQANQIELSHKTQELIAQLNEKLKTKEVELVIQNNSAETMEENIDQIINLALVGGLMAVFVLWMFLKNVRIVAFIALAIPVSVFTAFNFFYAYGITLNSLTLVGMALAIGMLLDNSVVVLENIYRLAGKGVDAGTAVAQGTTEVWRSIVAATLTTITVFLPFVFSSNFMIEMLGKNVGVSIISTLLVSLVVALLFVPMAIHFILKGKRSSSIHFEKLTTNNRMVQVYMLLLKSCMRYPAATVLGAVAVFFLTIFISLAISVSSLQEVEESQLQLYVTMPSGSSLEKTDETVQKIEEKLGGVKEKLDVISRIEEEEATVTLKLVEDFEKVDGRSFAEIKSSVNDLVKDIRSAEISFEQVQTNRSFGGGSRNMMGNFQRLLGIGTEEERIVLKGQDFNLMQTVAEDLEYFLEDMDIIDRVRLNVSDNRPEVHMIFDPLLMTEYGINMQQVSGELNSFTREISTGVMFNQGVDEYEITIKTGETEEEQTDVRTMDDLKMLQVSDAGGGLHDLQEFTQLVYARGLAGINRVNQEKQIEITYRLVSEAQQSKDLLTAYRYEIDALIANYAFPSGIAAEVIHEEDELAEFYFLILAAIVLIFMILASVFESIVTPFVLLFSIPLAAIGSLLALIITGNSLFNANTMIGFLILLGVVVNNGIILIDYSNILRKRGYRRSRALMTAGLSRVRPILITAITTIVAMVPLAMGQAEYVSVIGAPFAIIVIGGLALSTLLTLIFIPTFYSGLENALEWFRGLNWKLRAFQIALMALALVYIYLEVDTTTWKMMDTVLAVVLVPGTTWFVLNSLKKAGTQLIGPDEKVHIVIQNLVKIYDRPGRFSREWTGGLNIRRRAGLEKEFRSIREFDQLIWQLPLLAFMVYFTFIFLKPAFWISFMMLMVYFYLNLIWKPVAIYLENRYQETQKGIFRFLKKYGNNYFFWVLPLVELAILYLKTEYIGLVVAFAALWYLGLLISVTAKRLYEEKVNIDRITGRFGSLRRTVFRLVKQIPVIGKRRVPFKALNGVSLEIGTGMFGLLGPNGAGKSTMMRTICGILEQSYGKIWINGIDTQEKREELQGLIGYLPQEFGTYENMPAWDYLEYQALLKGLTDVDERKKRLEYVLKAVHMYDRRTEKIGSFSGGMKQRIGIAQILLHLPKILVVDEPTAGLDPRERIRFRNLLVELSRERIVIFSTHIIEDISSSCNQVAVIIRGRVKYHGTPINMVNLAENLVWQYEVPASEFDKMPNKQMVVHHMRVGEHIRVRVLSKGKPADDAVEAKPLLEDAYLCLIKDLK